MNKKLYKGLLCVFFIIVLYIYLDYIKPNSHKKIYQKQKQFKGFKYSHLTNKEEEQELTPPITSTNSHFLIYGTSGSGKTSFLKHYSNQTKSNFIVFGRDENEFNDNYIPLLQLEKKLNHLLLKLLYWMMQVHSNNSEQK